MSKDLTKKAAEMLLNGATLLGEPCPYCSGVRVMKDGHAFCCGCGREPEKREIKDTDQPKDESKVEQTPTSLNEVLEKKIEILSKELEEEKDHEKQQKILKSINAILETIEKTSKKR